jgi:D-sedoheptulose 7-phosphate isomerase
MSGSPVQSLDQTLVRDALVEASAGLAALLADDAKLRTIAQAGRTLADALRAGGRAFSCGNGGSMCDAMHFAEEMTGRFRESRPGYAATAIADAGHLSCVANDFGFEQVFSRYIEAHGRAGDILLAISTSGTSPNVVAAARAAQAKSMKVIALTGREGAALSQHADLTICTPAGRFADRVQELHIKVIHILIELIEHHMAGSSKTAGGK